MITQIFQNSLIPTFAIDKRHIVTHWNNACERFTGLSGENMVGCSDHWQAFHTEKRSILADFIVAKASAKEISNHFASMVHPSPLESGAYEGKGVFVDKKGKTRWLFFTAAPLINDQGQLIGAVQTLQDIVALECGGDVSDRNWQEIKNTETNKKQAEKYQQVVEDRDHKQKLHSTAANLNYDWEYWIKPGRNLVYSSPSVEQITGHRPEEFEKNGDLLSAIVHPNDQKTFLKHLEIKMKSDEVFQFDFRIITKKGEERWISHICQPLLDANGHHLGRRASNRDVTWRKQLEATIRNEQKELEKQLHERSRQLFSAYNSLQEEIQKREATYRALQKSESELKRRKEFIETILDNLPIGLAAYRISDGNVQYMNSEFSRIYGWPEHALGNFDAFFDHVYPDPKHRKVVKKRVSKDIATGDPAKMVWNNLLPITQSGKERVITAANIPLPEQDLMITTVRDVTERYKASQALQFTRFSIDHSNDLIYWLDPDGKIVDVNKTTCKKLGYKREELLSMTAIDIDPSLTSDTFLKNWKDLKNRGALRVETGHHCSSGEVIPVETHFDYITFDGKEYSCAFARDITERYELERLVSIQDKMGSLGRVAAGIAHEIRNPLSTINVYLSSLKRMLAIDNFDTDHLTNIEETITEMDNASRKIESVVRRVMDFSKPSTQKKQLADINQCIRDVVRLSQVTLRKSGIHMNVELDETLPECSIDYQLIEQMVLNLLTNAREELAEHEGDKLIEISTSFSTPDDNEKFITISVADSGPGVAIELQDKVFDPFFTTKQYGSGIGLSICHRIISDHDGTLYITTSKWGGAMFTAEFPLREKVVS